MGKGHLCRAALLTLAVTLLAACGMAGGPTPLPSEVVPTTKALSRGRWDSIPDWVSCFHRDGWEPDAQFIGFRCAEP